MTKPKITGHCSCCDERCFEVMQVFEAHEKYPGEPKELGPAEPDTQRVTFMLADGTMMKLTFCKSCAETMNSSEFGAIWDRILVTWARELNGEIPDWFREQFSNRLLYVMGRESWTKVLENERSC